MTRAKNTNYRDFRNYLEHPVLKRLDAKTLGVTASYDFEDFLSPALLSFDKKTIICDIGSGVEQRDVQTGEPHFLGQPPGVVRRRMGHSWYLKAADPSGPRLAVYRRLPSEKPTIVIWDYSTDTNVLELDANSWEYLGLAEAAFSIDGEHLYIASDVRTNDARKPLKEECDLSLWDIRNGRLLTRCRMEGRHARLSVSPDGRYVASACGQSVSLWTSNLDRSAATMEIRGSGWFPSIAFSPDSSRFTVHTGEAIVIYKIVG